MVDNGNTEAALAALAVGGDVLVTRQNATAVLDRLNELNILTCRAKQRTGRRCKILKRILILMIAIASVGLFIACCFGIALK